MKATQKFKSIFKIIDNRSKLERYWKAQRWWNGREQSQNALSANENRMMYVRCKAVPSLVEKRCAVKSLRGRGRKRLDWVEYLLQILLFEFERLRSSDLQLSRSLTAYDALAMLGKKSLIAIHLMLIQLLVDKYRSMSQ